jgi:hypothetical protein
LLNQRISVLVLCHSQRYDERYGILETARALLPDIKCVMLSALGLKFSTTADAELVDGLRGPETLLAAIETVLSHKALPQTV